MLAERAPAVAVPSGPWVMAQTWRDLLFAHWPVPADALRPYVAAACRSTPTTAAHGWASPRSRSAACGPAAWCRCRGSHAFRSSTSAPTRPSKASRGSGSSASTQAARPSPERGSRTGCRTTTPTWRSSASTTACAIAAARTQRRAGADLRATTVPPAPAPPEPGTLEHWLTERYCLYTVDRRGRILRAEIHHPPWPLQPPIAALERTRCRPRGPTAGARAVTALRAPPRRSHLAPTSVRSAT